MARIEKTIFISYRRKDISWALAVYQFLTSQKYDVFFDYTSIPSGDFEQIILSNIKARAHFVLILTPTALDRCGEPGDWLRREIETAIEERRNIVPLFFDGFDFRSPSVSGKLTGGLETLNRYNGFEVPAGFFLEAMERMRTKYLSVPLDAVIHPVPMEVQRKVEREQNAANKALVEQKKTLQEIIRPARTLSGRVVGIAASFLLVAGLGVYGLSSLIQNRVRMKDLRPGGSTVVTVATQPQPTFTQSNPTSSSIVPPTAIPTLGVGSIRFSDKDGMTTVYIPAGEFEMGSEDGAEDERPVHTVYLDAFWIDQTEVTNAMYAECVQDMACDPPVETESRTLVNYFNNPDYQNYPVMYVTWERADSYCSWANRRLPTEAEWEKAATWDEEEKKKDLYPWGPEMNCALANYRDTESGYCVGDTAPVGTYDNGKNAYGLYDMVGNVWEWVADWYDENYYAESPSANPPGPDEGDLKVLRGGSFVNYEDSFSPTHRVGSPPSFTPDTAGFRCAVSE